jgi:hypothetical protein
MFWGFYLDPKTFENLLKQKNITLHLIIKKFWKILPPKQLNLIIDVLNNDKPEQTPNCRIVIQEPTYGIKFWKVKFFPGRGECTCEGCREYRGESTCNLT